MRNQGTTLTDCSTPVSPPVICDHADDVAEVRPLESYRLHVRFNDSTQGMVHLSPLIYSQHAEIFAVLADSEVFSQVRVEFGAVSWPCGLDLAPDAMYAALRDSGSWTPR